METNITEDLFNVGFDLDAIATEKSEEEDKTVVVEVEEDKTEEGEELEEATIETDESETDAIEENEGQSQEEDDAPLDAQKAVYSILENYGYVDELEDGKELDLEEAFEAIEDKAFMNSVQHLPAKAKKILELAYQNKGVITDEDLTNLIQVNTETSEISYKDNPRDFLLKELEGHPTFPTEEELKDYLDDLEAKDKIAGVAEKVNLQKEELKSKREEEIQKDLEKRQALLDKQKQEYIQGIETAMESTSWTDSHKKTVANTIQNIGNISMQINNNPQALVNLADILTTFDPKTGEFDLEQILKKGSKAAKRNANSIKKSKVGSVLSKMGSKASTTSKRGKTKQDEDDIVIVIPN